jgi:ElaB/YqjD/DUF883 family membrane-anchored ribosome-binding protein
MDINKIITDSISALINEEKPGIVTEGVIDQNHILNLIQHKEAADSAKEAVMKAGGKVAEGAKEAGGKVAGFAKTFAKEGKDFVSENPKTSAAVAAALAAGIGAVAFRKKLAALAKKGMPVAKKKTAEVAKKIAKKLES